MVDRVDKQTRGRIMAKIPNKDTKPELVMRKALFKRGLRYRLHVRQLPGKPDLSFPRYRAVIFINGCFWHWHGCKNTRFPSDNAEYWHAKINRNRQRDQENYEKLLRDNWRILVVWECALTKTQLGATVNKVLNWIKSDSVFLIIEPSDGEGHQAPM